MQTAFSTPRKGLRSKDPSSRSIRKRTFTHHQAIRFQTRRPRPGTEYSNRKALNRKMRPRYLGPLIVISRNRGGAYILAELDGSVFDRPTAAFRVIPYFARQKIDLPPLDNLLDISRQRLTELENTDNTELDDNSPDDTDFLLDD